MSAFNRLYSTQKRSHPPCEHSSSLSADGLGALGSTSLMLAGRHRAPNIRLDGPSGLGRTLFTRPRFALTGLVDSEALSAIALLRFEEGSRARTELEPTVNRGRLLSGMNGALRAPSSFPCVVKLNCPGVSPRRSDNNAGYRAQLSARGSSLWWHDRHAILIVRRDVFHEHG